MRRLDKGTTWQLATASVSLWHGRVSAAGGMAAWLWHHTDDVVHASIVRIPNRREGEDDEHTRTQWTHDDFGAAKRQLFC